MLIGPLHKPIMRMPLLLRTASAMMPEGLEKLMSQAFGARRSIVRATFMMTGMVRSAFMKPPAPVVSWPRRLYFRGIFSSRTRASSMPTRTCPST